MERTAAYFQSTFNNSKGILQNCWVETINWGPPEETPEKILKCVADLGQSQQDYVRDTFHKFHKEIEKDSCKWILDDDTFTQWTSEGNSEQPLIWVGVENGSGKTTHAVWISEYLEGFAYAGDRPWVLYHFCDSRRPEGDRNVAASVLKGFMRQLCRKHPPLGSILYQEFRRTGPELFQHYQIARLWELFETMVSKSPIKRIFCIFDGADQCYEDNYLEEFLKRFGGFFTDRRQPGSILDLSASPLTNASGMNKMEIPSPQSPELRAIILSCEEPSCVVRELSPFPRLHLRNHGPQDVESPLRRFTDATIADIAAKVPGKKADYSESHDLVAKALEGNEHQSFVWVNLIAEKLKGLTQSEIKESISQIPSSPEEIYAKALLAIPARQKPHVAAVLKWVLLAARPLSPLELTKGVKYSLKTTFTKRNLKKTLLLCHDIVQKQVDGSRREIALKDYCLQQLCFDERSMLRQIEELNMFVFEKSDAHSELANTCISYLQDTANFVKSRRVRLKPADKLKGENATFFRKHPFLEYTIVHWTFHAKRGNLEKTDYNCSFFMDNSSKRKTWWESYWISLGQNFAWKWRAPGKFSLLHLAAFFDIVPLAQFIKGKGRIEELLNFEDNEGMKPLQRATERCQASMVKFLLECGDFDEAALRQAAKTGELSIIRMLLANRERQLRSPPTLSRQSSPRTPSSPFQSFNAVRKITLSSLADLQKKYDASNGEDSSTLSPGVKAYGKVTSESVLHIAATYGHDEAIRLFLEDGEDVGTATDGGWTPLHNAAWSGRPAIINRLIEAGADANGRTKESLTPLHCSVKNAQPEAVMCLLGKPTVNVDAEDQHGLTPFHMASSAGQIDIMEILLSHGVNIEYKRRQGWTPLMWACIHGQYPVVKFLLDHGADATSKWTYSPNGAGETVEVGLVALAKTNHQKKIAALVERHGAINAEPLDRDAADAILPVASTEEVHNLPIAEDFFAVDPEDAETEEIPATEDIEGDSESEGDSDTESEHGNDQSEVCRGLSGDGDEAGHSQVSTGHAVLGLGIHEATTGAIASAPGVELGAVTEATATHDHTPSHDQLPETAVPLGEVLADGTNENDSALATQEDKGLAETETDRHVSEAPILRPDEQNQRPEHSEDPVPQDNKEQLDLNNGSNGTTSTNSVTQDQKSKNNLFNTKRLFTWKRGSEDKGTTPVSAESPPEPPPAASTEVENAATAPRVVSTPPEPRIIEIEDIVGGAESIADATTVESAPSPGNNLDEPGSQSGRSFFGKTLFSKKKSVDNQ